MTFAPRIPPPADGSSVYGTPLDRAYNEFAASVARELTSLDAVTAEMVRLRCATYHDCRVCSSLRSADALDGGFDELAAAQIRTHDYDNLTAAQTVALKFVDAMVTSPSEIDPWLAECLRSHFSDEQIAEIILDVARWSFQKVKVALRLDAPRWQGLGTLSYDNNGRPVLSASGLPAAQGD
jgi:alkylhydroperoxidase family enzyme